MICLYNKDETDFTTNGICVLTPTVCTVSEVAGGSYELYLEHPIDEQGKSQLIVENMLIKAPVPPMSVPDITLPEVKLWRTKVATDLYSKLPVTKYPPSVSSDIKKVRANPLAYLWNPLILYAPGALVATGVGAGASIYRAVMPSQGVQPPAAIFWGYAAPVVGQQPTYTPGTVAESLSANELVSKIADYSAEWIQVRSLRGVVGYVRRDDCEETTEVHAGEVIPGHEITEQVFRIYNIECEDDTHLVCVNAKHISYDFQGNSLYDCNVQDADPMTAIAIIQGSLMIEDDRRIASDITNRLISQDWSFKNPINALLDPSAGMVKATGARLIRDNKDFFLLNSANAKRGISLSYGVNLRGVKWTRSVENVITRVVPRCSDESDGYLYITDGGPIVNGVVRNDGEMWVDSPIAGQYPFVKIEVLDCKYKVGEEYEKPNGTKEKRTEASCRADMKADAVRRFTDDVVDGIDITLEVEFVLLGDTEKYKQYKGLQRVNIYDIISVNTGLSGISANAQVNEYEYDCILKRYNSIKLGAVNSFQRRIPGYRVVNQSITYEKLSPDLINRIKTMNAGGSTSSGSSTPLGGVSNVAYVANSKNDDGVVAKGDGQASKVWKTDAQGNPAWRDEAAGITVVDNLNSTSGTDALSANMGHELDMKKADEKKLNGTSFSSVASLADLQTLIKNFITDYMQDNTVCFVTASFSASFEPFGGASFGMLLYRSNASYFSVLGASYMAYVVNGTYNNGTWAWEKIAHVDIVDNLTTNDGTKALSAAQGYALNSKISGKLLTEDTTGGESNLNNIKKNVVQFRSDWTNQPSGFSSLGTLIEDWNNGSGLQKYIPFMTNRLFYREYTNDTWQNWEEVAINSKTTSYEFTTEYSSILAMVNDQVTTKGKKLPFSFVKVGNAVLTDAPSGWGGAEFTGIVYGNGARLTVFLKVYNSSPDSTRDIFSGNWLQNQWRSIDSEIAEINSKIALIGKYFDQSNSVATGGSWAETTVCSKTVTDQGWYIIVSVMGCSDDANIIYQHLVKVNGNTLTTVRSTQSGGGGSSNVAVAHLNANDTVSTVGRTAAGTTLTGQFWLVRLNNQ